MAKFLDISGLSRFWSRCKEYFAPISHNHTKSNITDFPSSMPASDVYDWAKASSKPTYTASDVGTYDTDEIDTLLDEKASSSHTHDTFMKKTADSDLDMNGYTTKNISSDTVYAGFGATRDIVHMPSITSANLGLDGTDQQAFFKAYFKKMVELFPDKSYIHFSGRIVIDQIYYIDGYVNSTYAHNLDTEGVPLRLTFSLQSYMFSYPTFWYRGPAGDFMIRRFDTNYDVDGKRTADLDMNGYAVDGVGLLNIEQRDGLADCAIAYMPRYTTDELGVTSGDYQSFFKEYLKKVVQFYGSNPRLRFEGIGDPFGYHASISGFVNNPAILDSDGIPYYFTIICHTAGSAFPNILYVQRTGSDDIKYNWINTSFDQNGARTADLDMNGYNVSNIMKIISASTSNMDGISKIIPIPFYTTSGGTIIGNLENVIKRICMDYPSETNAVFIGKVGIYGFGTIIVHIGDTSYVSSDGIPYEGGGILINPLNHFEYFHLNKYVVKIGRVDTNYDVDGKRTADLEMNNFNVMNVQRIVTSKKTNADGSNRLIPIPVYNGQGANLAERVTDVIKRICSDYPSEFHSVFIGEIQSVGFGTLILQIYDTADLSNGLPKFGSGMVINPWIDYTYGISIDNYSVSFGKVNFT